MKIINTKNFEKIDDFKSGAVIDFDCETIESLKVLEENYDLIKIPAIPIINSKGTIWYMQKNMSEYIVLKNCEQAVEIAIRIQQNIKNDKPIIENIYVTILARESNILSNFLEFSKVGVRSFIANRVLSILTLLPYSEKELKWYKEEIDRLLTNEYTKKDTITTTPKTISTKKQNPARTFIVDGVKYNSANELCKAFGIATGTFLYRIEKGMSVEEALLKPIANVGRGVKK